HPAISPDGTSIACYSKQQGRNSPWELTVLSFGRNDVVKSFPIPMSVSQQWHGPRWTPDGRALTYIVDHGTWSDLWTQPVTGGAAHQLTDFKEGQIVAFAWSGDGRYLACARTATITEIVLVEHFNRWQ